MASTLSRGAAIAVGFECPLFVPLGPDESRLTAARVGEGSRSWSAGAGCGALATGVVQVAWVLREIRNAVHPSVPAFLCWDDFAAARRGLLIWEAFVSGTAKGADHVSDARLGAEAFMAALPTPARVNAVSCSEGVYSLAGAALLRAGWHSDVSVLDQACLVVKAGGNAL